MGNGDPARYNSQDIPPFGEESARVRGGMMKFGLTLANMGPTAQRENMLQMARLGQELKFDSI